VRLVSLVRLARRFLTEPANLHAILPVDLQVVEKPRDSLEGAKVFVKNIEVLPKGPTLSQGAKHFWVYPEG
jgi:hypothetical protein